MVCTKKLPHFIASAHLGLNRVRRVAGESDEDREVRLVLTFDSRGVFVSANNSYLHFVPRFCTLVLFRSEKER